MSRYSNKVIEIEKQAVFIERKIARVIRNINQLHSEIKSLKQIRKYGSISKSIRLKEEILQKIRKYEYFYINMSKHMRKPLNDILKIKSDEVTELKNLTRKLYAQLSRKRKLLLEKLNFIVGEFLKYAGVSLEYNNLESYLYFRAQLDCGYAMRAVDKYVFDIYLKNKAMTLEDEDSDLHLTATPHGLYTYGEYFILVRTNKLRPYIHPNVEGKQIVIRHSIPFSEWAKVYHFIPKNSKPGLFEEEKQYNQLLMKKYKLPFPIITIQEFPKLADWITAKVLNLRRKYIKMYSQLFEDEHEVEYALKEVDNSGWV
jgi:hypothetical protein